MQRYGVVYADMWYDEDVKGLSVLAKLVYVYLLSSPHSNMSGYYKLPPVYAAEDLQIEPLEYDEAIDELTKSGFVFADGSTVLVRSYLKHNKIANDKQAKGVWNYVDRMPLSPLTVEFAHLCILYAPLVVNHFDALTIRYLADNFVTKDGIDISLRLCSMREDYRVLFEHLNSTTSRTEQIQNRTEQNRELSDGH